MPTVDTDGIGYLLKRVYKKGQRATGDIARLFGGDLAVMALGVGDKLAKGTLTKKRAKRSKRNDRQR